MNRRSLITGLISLVAAPAIVRASALMPISGDTYRIWQHSCPMLPDILAAYSEDFMKDHLGPNGRLYKGTWTFFGKNRNIYSDEVIAFSREEYPEHGAVVGRITALMPSHVGIRKGEE